MSRTTGILAFLLALALATLAPAQLNGNYTIDPSGSGSTNFKTFSAAASALGAGVSGPVAFQVASTVFKETVVLNAIKGTSSTNTVTFAATGAPATIDANGGQDALTLNTGTAWVRFVNLKIIGWTRYGIALIATNNPGANNNIFTAVESDGPASGSTSVRALYLERSDSNQFNQCVLRCGGNAVWNSISHSNVFESCEMDGKNQAQWVAFYINANANDSDNVIQNCFIHSPLNSTSGVALYVKASQYGIMMFNNTILCNITGMAVQMGGIDRSWGKANGFKNNIVVNLGSGGLMEYWYYNIGSSPSNTIAPTVTDYNCFYCPQNPKYFLIRGFSPQTTFFNGNLAAFHTWQQTTPSPVWPGGPKGYELNSIESDPGLVSMTAPYDIHLKAGSPCVDRGTSQFVESYQTFNANHTVTTDFEGDTRSALVDIGADEVAVSLVGSGSGKPGTPIAFSLLAAPDAGLPYQMGSSLGNGPIPLGSRQIGLTPDNLLVVSVGGFLPMIFQNYAGLLDAKGQATARLNIPNIPGLKGVRIYTAFVTLRASAPFGIGNISNSFLFTVQ